MATAPLTYPTLASGKSFDSKKFSETPNDPGMRDDTEGGYAITRARYTRKPRRVYGAGHTSITQQDKDLLDDFWDEVRGTARAFNWTNPATGRVLVVRFKSAPSWTYSGAGATRLYDCSIEMETV
jgi:phage-related protein